MLTPPDLALDQACRLKHADVAGDPAVERVKAAITEFAGYVAQNEPGTRMYTAWQREDDPTQFVHLFEFAGEAAHRAHGSSAAVRKFEDVYKPELAGGPVVFTNYDLIASNGAGKRPP